MLLSVPAPVPPRAWPWQAGAGTSPSPCLQVLLFLQDALNPVSHPVTLLQHLCSVRGWEKAAQPGTFPQVFLRYKSCLKSLGSSLGCAGEVVAFLSVHLSGVPQPESVLGSLGKQEQPLAGDQRPSWDSWKAELSQTPLQWHHVPMGTEDGELVPLGLFLAQQSSSS